jgi:hypothetical protein
VCSEAAAADVEELAQAIAAVRRIEEDYQAIAWKTHDNEREVLAALGHLMQFLPLVTSNRVLSTV